MSENTKPNQVQRVLAYMRRHGGITQFDADQYLGVRRLPSRICEIKKMGIPVKDEWVYVKNRFDEKCRVKKYSLAEEDEQ